MTSFEQSEHRIQCKNHRAGYFPARWFIPFSGFRVPQQSGRRQYGAGCWEYTPAARPAGSSMLHKCDPTVPAKPGQRSHDNRFIAGIRNPNRKEKFF